MQQSDSALAGLRAAFILVPATGTIIGIWVMRNYDLDEAKVNQIRAELDARSQSETQPSGNTGDTSEALPAT